MAEERFQATTAVGPQVPAPQALDVKTSPERQTLPPLGTGCQPLTPDLRLEPSQALDLESSEPPASSH